MNHGNVCANLKQLDRQLFFVVIAIFIIIFMKQHDQANALIMR